MAFGRARDRADAGAPAGPGAPVAGQAAAARVGGLPRRARAGCPALRGHRTGRRRLLRLARRRAGGNGRTPHAPAGRGHRPPAGLVLQAAACITGDNPAHIARLPDVTGLRHEFIIQRAHRFSYDQAYRVPGGVLVEIELGRRTMAWELEHAIGERTAGVIHLVSPFTSPPGVLGFEEVCRIAHARGVPVLVDAASMIPPRDNLFRYLRGGADLVVFSGGKGIRGPQSTGILAGRRDLIRAATLNASPNQAIGRAAKTSKEEVVGLVTALDLFLAEDEKAETERFRAVSASIVDGLADIPGLRVVVGQDPANRVLPPAVPS